MSRLGCWITDRFKTVSSEFGDDDSEKRNGRCHFSRIADDLDGAITPYSAQDGICWPKPAEPGGGFAPHKS